MLIALKGQGGPDEGEPDEKQARRFLGPVERIVQDVAEEDADKNEGRFDGEQAAAGDLQADPRKTTPARAREATAAGWVRDPASCGGVIAPPQLGFARRQEPRAALTLS